MLKNYLKIAIRNLMRNSVFTFINIVGLSLGIAASMLIALWVMNELSYNKFHPNYDRLYQVYFFGNLNGEIGAWHEISYPVYEDLKTNHNGIKNATITDLGSSHLLTVNENRVRKQGRFVSPEFLKVFHFDLISGSAENVLDNPLSIVLTESLAKTIFNDQDPLGRIIRIDNRSDVTVTGIIKDVPLNSTIKFDYLLTFELFRNTTPWVKEEICEWYGDAFSIYAELQPDADLSLVNREIKGLYQNRDERFLSKELFLYPMNRWNLHGEFENGKEADVDWSSYVSGFSALALGILIIACINFMNLSTARSERRAREVGIRKIVGSQRRQLIYQFIGESILLSSMAFFLGLALMEMALPFYNHLIDEKLFIDYGSPLFWFVGLVLIVITGLIAGSYPAFYLSSFNPSKVLKGKLYIGRDGILPRKLLVVFQFAFSIILIIGTVVIYQQMEYVKNRQLGYDKQNLISIVNNPELERNYKTIKQELLRTGSAIAVTKTNSPIAGNSGRNFLNWPGNQGLAVVCRDLFADYDYVKTMGIKIVEGRDFSEAVKTDTMAVLVNQTAIDMMRLKNPIGAEISIALKPAKIIGIMGDIVMGSPYEPIGPMYVRLKTDWANQDRQFVSIRLDASKNLAAQLNQVEGVFKKLNPSYPFEFTFVDDDFNTKFYALNVIQKLVNVFAFLAIAIASLGLFGLAAFTVEKRAKEFGIRRVLGATVSNLVVLISHEFTRLVLIAIILSCPVAWLGLQNFLEYYPYHISLSWWILPLAGLVAMVITLMIVTTQAMRSASISPSESLKYE